MKKEKNVILIILDGWGLSKIKKGNAIYHANTKNFDYFFSNYPSTRLFAHGKYVGLPDEQDGNSEAGHMNLGAGRIVLQDAVYILESIRDGTFFKNTAFLEAIKHVKKYKSKLHLMGLLTGKESPHAYPSHLYALLKLARQKKIEKVFLHLFTDGRDSSPHGAIKFLRNLRKRLKSNEKIASIVGRYYAMDRKKKWENIEKVYNLLLFGEGEKVKSPEEAVVRAYNRGLTDEFVPPCSIVGKEGNPIGLIEENDAIIFFNLRSDRARELTKTFAQPDFNKMNPGSFKRKKVLTNIKFVAMTDFGPDLNVLTAFPSRDIVNTLPFALKGKKQLYIAESEKYAHVTYFFNGGWANPVAGEERIRVPSPDIAHYDEKPEMSAKEVTKIVIEKLNSKKYNFICVNYANPDMIGHTGNFKAGIKCCEIIDKLLGEVVKASLKNEFCVVVTADHGNIEEMINPETGEVDTKHSKNQVPFIIIDKELKRIKLKEKGCLGNVAPTILKIMGIKKPKDMKKRALF